MHFALRHDRGWREPVSWPPVSAKAISIASELDQIGVAGQVFGPPLRKMPAAYRIGEIKGKRSAA